MTIYLAMRKDVRGRVKKPHPNRHMVHPFQGIFSSPRVLCAYYFCGFTDPTST
jgi:hypothetical protein